MVAASGKCYPQNSTVRYKWANTLITTSQDRNNLLQDRVEKPALALYRTLAKLNNWRVLTKMVHIHWKVDATLNPSVSTFKKMTNRSGLWVSVAMTQLSFPFQIVWLPDVIFWTLSLFITLHPYEHCVTDGLCLNHHDQIFESIGWVCGAKSLLAFVASPEFCVS